MTVAVGEHVRPTRSGDTPDGGSDDGGGPDESRPRDLDGVTSAAVTVHEGERFERGVYRVVGAADDVALLRVADADGRRVHGGEVVVVAREVVAEAFEPAPDPDAGFDPVRWLANLVDGLHWTVRAWL